MPDVVKYKITKGNYTDIKNVYKDKEQSFIQAAKRNGITIERINDVSTQPTQSTQKPAQSQPIQQHHSVAMDMIKSAPAPVKKLPNEINPTIESNARRRAARQQGNLPIDTRDAATQNRVKQDTATWRAKQKREKQIGVTTPENYQEEDEQIAKENELQARTEKNIGTVEANNVVNINSDRYNDVVLNDPTALQAKQELDSLTKERNNVTGLQKLILDKKVSDATDRFNKAKYEASNRYFDELTSKDPLSNTPKSGNGDKSGLPQQSPRMPQMNVDENGYIKPYGLSSDPNEADKQNKTIQSQRTFDKYQKQQKLTEDVEKLTDLNDQAQVIQDKIDQGTATEQEKKSLNNMRIEMTPPAMGMANSLLNDVDYLHSNGLIAGGVANYTNNVILRQVAKLKENNLGIGDALTNQESWEDILSGGWLSVVRNQVNSHMLKEIGKADEQTKEGLKTCMNLLTSSDANTVNSNFWYDAVGGVMSSMSYMGQMAVTGGIGDIANLATNQIVKKTAKNLFKQGIQRGAIRTTTNILSRTIPKMIAFATVSPFAYKYAQEQTIKRVGADYSLSDIQMSDVIKGYGKMAIEYVVEGSGEVMKAGVGKLVGTGNGMASRWFNYLKGKSSSEIKMVMKEMKWNGLGYEYGEEVLQNIIDCTLWDEMSFKQLTDPYQNLVTLSTCALIASPATAIQGKNVARDMYKLNKDIGRVAAVDKNVATNLQAAMSHKDNQAARYEAVRNSGIYELGSVDAQRAALDYFIRSERNNWQNQINKEAAIDAYDRQLTTQVVGLTYKDKDGTNKINELTTRDGNQFFVMSKDISGTTIIVRPVIDGQIGKPQQEPATLLQDGQSTIRNVDEYIADKKREFLGQVETEEAAAEQNNAPINERVIEETKQEYESATKLATELNEKKQALDSADDQIRKGSIVKLTDDGEDNEANAKEYTVVSVDGDIATLHDDVTNFDYKLHITPKMKLIQQTIDLDEADPDQEEINRANNGEPSVYSEKNQVNDTEIKQNAPSISENTPNSGQNVELNSDNSTSIPNNGENTEVDNIPNTENINQNQPAFPMNKEGDIDIDKLDTEQALLYTAQEYGIQEAYNEAQEQIKAIKENKKALIEAKSKEANSIKRTKLLKQIKEANRDIKTIKTFINNIDDKDININEEGEDIESSKELSNAERLDNLGNINELHDLRLTILNEIARGQKFIWDGNKVQGNYTAGLGQELGFIRKDGLGGATKSAMGEFRPRIAMLSYKNGTSPARFSERIAEEYNYDQQDAYNETLDVLRSVMTPRQAISEMETVYDKYLNDATINPEGQDYEESERQAAAFQLLLQEEERQAINEVFLQDIKESDISLFNDAKKVGIEYEDFVKFNTIDDLIEAIVYKTSQENGQENGQPQPGGQEKNVDNKTPQLQTGEDESVGRTIEDSNNRTTEEYNQEKDGSGQVNDGRQTGRNEPKKQKLDDNNRRKDTNQVSGKGTTEETNGNVELAKPQPTGSLSGESNKSSSNDKQTSDLSTRNVPTRSEEVDKTKVTTEGKENSNNTDRTEAAKGNDTLGDGLEEKSKTELHDLEPTTDLNSLEKNIAKILTDYRGKEMAALQVEDYLNEHIELSKDYLAKYNITTREELNNLLGRLQTNLRKGIRGEQKQAKTEDFIDRITQMTIDAQAEMQADIDEYNKKEQDNIPILTEEELKIIEKNDKYVNKKLKENKPIENKIEDYGEKIGGAKKDLAKEMADKIKDITNDDIVNLPLSKVLPKPNYIELKKNGMNMEGLIMLSFLYDNIPVKPKKYGIDRYVREVKSIMQNVENILKSSNEQTKDLFNEYNERIKGVLMNYKYELDALDFPNTSLKRGKFNIRKFEYKDKPTKYSVINGYSIIQDFSTLEEAQKGYRQIIEAGQGKGKINKLQEYSIYKRYSDNKFFITPKGKPRIIIQDGFDSLKEVNNYLKENRTDLDEKYSELKEVPSERNQENRERVGIDWTNGKNITNEEFANTFGFRAIEYGNWVNQTERQDNLNNAYNALMDLSEVIGVSPKALSLNGELALAFGSRGNGNASAHYERNKVVINLTKTKGAGSLAHEWFHALDNYFSRRRGQKNQMITEIPRQLNNSDSLDTTRQELLDSFKDLMKSIMQSDYYTRAKNIDEIKSKKYWSTPVEMSARAFESYVIEKLSENGIVNDYLANFKNISEYLMDINGNVEKLNKTYPYPMNEESKLFNEKFDNLFNTIQEKVDDEKNVILFRKNQSKIDRLSQLLNPEENINKKFDNTGNSSNFENQFIDNGKEQQTELDYGRTMENDSERGTLVEPERRSGIYRTIEACNSAGSDNTIRTIEEREELEGRGLNPDFSKRNFRETLRKVAKENGVWLDSSFLNDKTLIHDQRAAGTSENDVYLNSDGKTLTKLNNLSYVNGLDTHNNLKALIDRLDTHNKLFPNVAYNIIGFIDNKNGVPSMVLEQPFVQSKRNATQSEIDNYLAKIGFSKDGKRNWSNEHEVWSNGNYEIYDARPANVLVGEDGNLYFIDTIPHSIKYINGENDVRFRSLLKGGYYSTIDDALDKIKQDKGTKDQFKAMLLKNGAKQAELDWVGFDELPDKLTKQDIKDWLDVNKIEIEEVEKNKRESTYSKYVLPGGENYKELLLTMPTYLKSYSLIDVKTDKTIDISNDYEKLIDRRNELGGELVVIENEESKGLTFKSAHYVEPNILAHIRFDERTDEKGNNVLFIEEFQSDWAQKGKKQGFSTFKKEEFKFNQSNTHIEKDGDIILLKDNENGLIQADTFAFNLENKSDKEMHDYLLNIANGYSIRNKDIQTIPDMPFKTTDQWLNLSFRRMMHYAAENGFDRIAWTNGEQQADRYNLSKKVNYIEYDKTPTGNYVDISTPSTFATLTVDNKGKVISVSGNNLSNSVGKDLSDVIGKDIAGKIITGLNNGISEKLKGDGLKVGGEGMKGFYDNIVPKIANKLGKSFNSNVENIEIEGIGQQQSLPITDTMKNSVMRGIPLFRSVKQTELQQAEQEVNTNPSDAQKEAGNYKMGHVKLFGFDISIEQPKGSIRKGIDPDGKSWESYMNNSYGYIRGSKGIDGDHVDVFIGNNLDSQKVFVIDQVNKDGSFDEHKCMLGFNSEREAKENYLANYEKGWNGIGNITEVSLDTFNDWVINGTKKQKPFAEYVEIKKEAERLQDMKLRAESLATELHSSVNFISSKEMPQGHSKDKAYYNIKNKQTYINLDSHDDIVDIEKTIFHETVAHEGLRDMFGDNFDEFLDNIYNSVTDEVRVKIDTKANLEGYTKRIATEEYLAELAEQGFDNRENANIWEKVKQFFKDMVSKAKLGMSYRIDDNDLSYILWRSYENKKAIDGTIDDKINDIAKRDRWDINSHSEYDSEIYALEDTIRAEYPYLTRKVVEETENALNQNVDKKNKKIIDRFFKSVLDAGLPLKQLCDSLKAQNGNLPFNVYTRHQTINSTVIAILEKFEATIGRRYMDVLKQIKHKTDITYEQIGIYHMAKYMRERTQYLLDRGVEDKYNEGLAGEKGLAEYMANYNTSLIEQWNKNNRGKGVKDLDKYISQNGFSKFSPEEYVSWFENKIKSTTRKNKDGEKLLNDLNEKCRDIVNFTLDKAVQTGALSRVDYIDYKQSKNYVPLRGWRDEESSGEDNVFQWVNVQAKGRRSLADNPIPYMFAMAESVVKFGVKNDVKQDVATLLMLNEDKLYDAVGFTPLYTWDYTDDEGNFAGVRCESDVKEFYNDKNAVKESLEVISVYSKDKDKVKLQAAKKEYTEEFKQHLLTYTVDGQKKTIYVEDKGIVKAFDKQNLSNFSSLMGRMKGGIARYMTSRNPGFVFRNTIRDLGTVLFLNKYDHDLAFKSRVLFNMVKLTPTIASGVCANKWESDGRLRNMYNDWVLQGGRTGYAQHYKSIKELEKEIKRMSYGKTKSYLWNAITLKWVEYGAEIFENITRFSVYATALEKGYSKVDALQMSKECSVNFDKKGTDTTLISQYFAFFNPTVQGAYKIGQFAFGKGTRVRALTTVGLLIFAGWLSSFLRDKYDDKADERSLYKKRRNILIGSLTIPVSFDLLPPFTLGNLIHELKNGQIGEKEFYYEAAMSLTGLIPEQGQNIINSMFYYNEKTGNIENWNPLMLVEALPTVFLPIGESMVNRNYMGGKIIPENKYQENTSRASLYNNSQVYEADKFIAKVINLIGNFDWKNYDENNSYINGKERWFDVSPADVRHFTSGYLSGLSQFWGSVSDVASLKDASTEEILSKAPITSGFYTKANPNIPVYNELNKMSAKYAAIIKQADQARQNSKRIDNTPIQTERYEAQFDKIKENPLYQEAKQFEKLKKDFSKLNRNLNAADKTGNTNESKRITEELEKLKKQILNNNNSDESDE